jgi:hypothetical protein
MFIKVFKFNTLSFTSGIGLHVWCIRKTQLSEWSKVWLSFTLHQHCFHVNIYARINCSTYKNLNWYISDEITFIILYNKPLFLTLPAVVVVVVKFYRCMIINLRENHENYYGWTQLNVVTGMVIEHIKIIARILVRQRSWAARFQIKKVKSLL